MLNPSSSHFDPKADISEAVRSTEFVELTPVDAAPPSRAVTLVPGKNTREMALVDKTAELSNIRKLLAGVL